MTMRRMYQVDFTKIVLVVASSQSEAETIAIDQSGSTDDPDTHVPESIPRHLAGCIPWGDSDGETAEKWLAKS